MAAGGATAAVVTSADCANTPRSISVGSNQAASCLASGRGATGGIGDAFRGGQSGWVVLDRGNSSLAADTVSHWLAGVLSGTQGSFSIDAAAWAAFDHLALGFQSGGSRSDPDWVVFQLAEGTLDGLWSISAQNVGHMVLYGMNDATLPTLLDVPEPGSLALAGLAFAGLALGRRKQLAAKPA